MEERKGGTNKATKGEAKREGTKEEDGETKSGEESFGKSDSNGELVRRS